jgi:rare lipoprotein A
MKLKVIIPVLLIISIISKSTIAFSHNVKKPEKVKASKPKLPQKGKASFYSNKYTGKRTANSERYNPTLFTAAHETLPLGKMVKVTNLANNESTIVKINDRCKCNSLGRIIDLSMSAANQLKMIEKGVVKVRIEELAD